MSSASHPRTGRPTRRARRRMVAIATGALVAAACAPVTVNAQATPQTSYTAEPGDLVAVFGLVADADDLQRVLVDDVVRGARRGENQTFPSQARLGRLPPTAQIVFEAENASGAFSWNLALSRVTDDYNLVPIYGESHRSDALGRIGVVRRVVLTPNADIIGECGEVLPALSCIPPADGDNDGVSAGPDCDDSDQARRPGALEVRGNAVDENCDGRVEALPRASGSVRLRSIPLDDGRTSVASLAVRGVSRASTIRLACTGTGCGRLRRTTLRAPAGADTVSLTGRVRRLRLGPDAKLSVRIAAPARRTRVFTFTFRRGLAPTLLERCANPGRSALSAC